MNRLTEAEPLYQRALVIYEKSYGVDHPEVARTIKVNSRKPTSLWKPGNCAVMLPGTFSQGAGNGRILWTSDLTYSTSEDAYAQVSRQCREQ